MSVLSKQLVVGGGLLVLPLTMTSENRANFQPVQVKPPEQPAVPKPDPRAVRLRRFLSRLHCPITNLSDDFVHAADRNHLDWRLLPSISVIESGGGKAYRNNNIFGWNNGIEAFTSLREGLELVAYKLGRSPLYRNRDSVEKLRLYNPDEDYANKVLEVMNRISPVRNLSAPAQRPENDTAYAN
ncbi:MAG: glucosaminidase domain-containing protein [Acidobacteriaceae bacterium]|nr:glucosaminidase domain-containing protein [Acidobacteriaceae bacterium]